MAVQIRPYDAARDFDDLTAVGQEVVDEGTVFPFESVEGVLAYWLGPGTTVFVATIDEQVAGSYALKANLPGRGSHVANAGYMVAGRFRRRGVGRLLGEHSLSTAAQLGFTAMQYNHVVASNESALRLWTTLGFRTVGRVPKTFRHPRLGMVDTCIMYRELG